MKTKIDVLIPAYNESKKIAGVLAKLKKLDYNLRVIVVDDGSKDDTSAQAKKAGAFVARHPLNLGQWAALRTAILISSMDPPDIFVTLDADGQHSPDNFQKILEPVLNGDADLVVGSRFLIGNPEMPTHRYYGIKLFNFLVKLRSGVSLSDCTCGYKAYDYELLTEILPSLTENQYGALESIIMAARRGGRITEVPVENIKGEKSSKGRLRYGVNLIRTVIKSLLFYN